jgi:hypothetical protein
MKKHPLGELFETAVRVQTLLEQHKIKFCFIGGVAVQRWGKVRITRDVDLTLYAGFGNEDYFINLLAGTFTPRRPDYHEFAQLYRIALLSDENGVGIDISLGAMPFEEDMIARSSLFEFITGCNLRTCSAEDLIILKSYANRDQDWFDIRNVLIRFKKKIDPTTILDVVSQLAELKGEPEIADKLTKLINETS